MPLTEKGAKILRHMESQYGEKRGKSVFFASSNAGKISGVHHDADFAAETGETPGKAINVSEGITPAMLNERAQAMHAPETQDGDEPERCGTVPHPKIGRPGHIGKSVTISRGIAPHPGNLGGERGH